MIRRCVVFCILLPIRAYQLLVSPFMLPCCRFAPSCSHYAREAVMLHGACAGGWLALKRLARCHPFGGYGYDPVPEKESTHDTHKLPKP